MTRTILRLTSAVGLAVCLSLVFTPLGCGGSSQGSVEPARAANEGPQVPEGTFSAMMECVTDAKGRLTDTVYAMQFDVEVTERGEAGRVKFRDSSPSERALEACIGHALEGMTVPVSVLRRIPKEKAASTESRGLMGQVWEEVLLVGAGVSLGPIYLTAAGVTVIVMVGVYATSEAVDKYRKLRKRREKCLDMFVTCVNDRPSSCKHITDYGKLLCALCREDCEVPKPYTYSECYQCGFYDP
jgi:hypothetical protein